MSAPESSELTTDTTESAGETSREATPSAPRLHLPDEDIRNRPRLKVKPIGSRTAADKPTLTVRAKTAPDTADEEPPNPSAGTDEEAGVPAPSAVLPVAPVVGPPAKKVSLPDPDERQSGYAFATHRPAPPDRKSERAELAAVTGGKAGRQVSTGFVLGVALIVATLIGGVMVARLGKRVRTLEARIAAIEAAEFEVATGEDGLP